MSGPVTACPKCRNGRENHRWPFCIASGTGEDEFTLKVECRRCGHDWIEPSADALTEQQSKDLKEVTGG